MEKEKFMVVNTNGKSFFNSLEEMLHFVDIHFPHYFNRLFKKVDDKWIVIGSVWPKSSL